MTVLLTNRPYLFSANRGSEKAFLVTMPAMAPNGALVVSNPTAVRASRERNKSAVSIIVAVVQAASEFAPLTAPFCSYSLHCNNCKG